jgi:Na+/melibiose symporter-like transporter
MFFLKKRTTKSKKKNLQKEAQKRTHKKVKKITASIFQNHICRKYLHIYFAVNTFAVNIFNSTLP